MTDAREKLRQIARDAIARGDLTGWFEKVYADAYGDPTSVSWADLKPNPHLMEWTAPRADQLHGKRALVVGCGLGDDAEALAALGMDVTAFDISRTAVEWCQRRFPASQVDYVVANATEPPAEWMRAFDLVVEIYTLQVLLTNLRRKTAEAIAGCVAQGGQLIVICRGREADDPLADFPWPLTKAELDKFTQWGLTKASFEDFMDGDVRRFRAVYRRE